MSPDQLLCFCCMRALTAPGQTCPHCGHDNRIRHNGPGLLGETMLAGQYQVGRVLGRGGFGVTYIGYDRNLEHQVAIKEYFPPELAIRKPDGLTLSIVSGGEDNYLKGLERALKESRVAASLHSIPGVMRVFNVVSANNSLYIIMEYVEGPTLTRVVEEAPQPLAPQQALALLALTAKALAGLHQAKVIHRDVKPDNIIIRKSNRKAVLLDFGAARIANSHSLGLSIAVVSSGYSPPEQYDLSANDGRIDEYALAATLFYTLTGRRPPDVMQRMARPDAMPSPTALNPLVPPALEKAILKGMALKAADRYPDVDTFWQACSKAVAPKTNKSAKVAIIAAAGALLAAGLLGLVLPGTGRTPAGTTDPQTTAVQTTAVQATATQPAADLTTATAAAAPAQTAAPRPLAAATSAPTAAPTTPASDFKYSTQKDGTLCIDKYRGSDSHVSVPGSIGGVPVTAIGKEAFCYNNDLHTVTLPRGVTAIHEYAFYGCKNLTGVSIPEGVATIGHYAFHSCESLREISLPGSVSSIGNSVFYGCSGLTEIAIPAGITRIGDYAFHSCTQLKKAELPEGVTSIGYYAFFGCESLTGLILPRSLTAIDSYAFYGCKSLRTLAIPAKVTAIGQHTFSFCDQITLVVTPGSHALRYAETNNLNHIVK